MMTEEEELNFTRSGVIRIYEKMKAGEMTEEDFHRAAANTEAILKEGGSDITVRYMGTMKEHIRTLMEFKAKPRQTKLFEEETA